MGASHGKLFWYTLDFYIQLYNNTCPQGAGFLEFWLVLQHDLIIRLLQYIYIYIYIGVCFDVMYSGEYNVFDVTLSVYPHRAG